MGSKGKEEGAVPVSSQNMSQETNRLSTTLFNQKKYRILSLLLTNPDKQFSISEIKEQADVSRPLISNFIDELRDLGLVKKDKKGNLYLIEIETGSPYYNALKEVLELDARPLKKAAKDLAKEMKKRSTAITSIYLFGSVARGTPRLDSDIDLLVIYQEENLSQGDKEKMRSLAKKQGDKLNVSFSLTWYQTTKFEEDLEWGESFAKKIKEEGVLLEGERVEKGH